MEKHWITLFQDTFIWIKKMEGLIYSSNKFRGFHFVINDKISRICNDLMLPANLYSTLLTKEDMENNEVQKWVYSITNGCKAGFITPGMEKRPVSFKPILKILDDKEYYVWENQKGFGGSILQNLHELTFYLYKTDTYNNSYFKKDFFPEENRSLLDVKSIISFIHYSQNPFLSNITLVGNLFLYSFYKELLHEIASIESNFTIKITIQDFNNHIQDIKKIQWPENVRFNVLIDFIPFQSYIALDNINVFIFVTVFIFSENEYKLFFDQFKNLPVYCDAHFIPIYKGDNLHFFEEYVFINQEDIEEIGLSKREIFMHQILNTNDFGNLNISSDGHVYANIYMEPLGTLDDTVYSLVYKELTEGQSWLRIRNMKPCCDCIYQWLCPSPSNYELIIGKPNLCHVMK